MWRVYLRLTLESSVGWWLERKCDIGKSLFMSVSCWNVIFFLLVSIKQLCRLRWISLSMIYWLVLFSVSSGTGTSVLVHTYVYFRKHNVLFVFCFYTFVFFCVYFSSHCLCLNPYHIFDLHMFLAYSLFLFILLLFELAFRSILLIAFCLSVNWRKVVCL